MNKWAVSSLLGTVVLGGVLFWQLQSFRSNEKSPCRDLFRSCRKAGVFKNGKESKRSFFRDCIQPAVQKGEIAGILVDKAIVERCREGVRKKRNRRKGNRAG